MNEVGKESNKGHESKYTGRRNYYTGAIMRPECTICYDRTAREISPCLEWKLLLFTFLADVLFSNLPCQLQVTVDVTWNFVDVFD